MSGWMVVFITIGLIALSAFFVAAEFALLAARRHRLQDAAATSRSARAALRSSGELTVLLAGCQLGITVAALALGAITKPAVHYALSPVFETLGLPYWGAHVSAFALALIFVTFLHLVVGEMAPKSWAIAHPESSATLLALPMRGFMWLTRPVLIALNESANWCLRRVGVEPRDTVASGRAPEDLRQLVEHSAVVGVLDVKHSEHLALALDLQALTVADLLPPGAPLTAVSADATVADVRAASKASGHLRILLRRGEEVTGVVHVRDTMQLPSDAPVAEVMRPVFTVDARTAVHSTLSSMRETRNHLAVVLDGGTVRGVVTFSDILERFLPQAAAVGAGQPSRR